MKTKGAILMNLGTPMKCNRKSVGAFLREFLMDKYVINIPFPMRYVLTNFIIVPNRVKEVTEVYSKVWDQASDSSLLRKHMIDITNAVRSRVDFSYVDYAFRYGQESILHAIRKAKKEGVTDLVVYHMYPQYSESTVQSTVDAINYAAKQVKGVNITIGDIFYKDQRYLKILSDKISHHIQDLDLDLLVFSYHGLPKSHVEKLCQDCKSTKCDPVVDSFPWKEECYKKYEKCYLHQSYYMTNKVVDNLGLKFGEYHTVFQSRLGALPWLQPYADNFIRKLPRLGAKKIAVVSPSFVADCIETEFEIGDELQEEFMEAGGEEFKFIPCLNSSDSFIEWLSERVDKFINA